MGAVNQLLAGTGLQVSASNPSNNVNNNNLPGSKLMARRRREEYDEDEQYAGDKYVETDDMNELEDDDYSASEGEFTSNNDADYTDGADETPSSDDYSSSDDSYDDYTDDYASASESSDGELGLRSGEDSVSYQINTEQQQNQLRPTSGDMDMYIGTSNLYSDLVGLKPETFRSESMDNEFNANDYIGFAPENSILPSVTTDSVVGSFTGDNSGIFSTFAPDNENAFVPTLDGTFGFFGGEEQSEEESPFVPSVAGAIGLGLGIGLGSALGVPTTMFNNPMDERTPIQKDFNKSRSGTVGISQPRGNVLKKESTSASTITEISDNSVITPQSVSSEPEPVVSQPVPSEPEPVVHKQHMPSELSISDEKDKESGFEKADKKAKKLIKRMEEHKDASSERKIKGYERSARELMNKNELSTNQYEAVRAAKEHSNEMADLRRRNQLAELQHNVAMRAKDKEMLDIMRNENIDAIKYNTEMKNRGQPQTGQYEMMSPSNYTDDETIGSGLDDILGLGGGSAVNSEFATGFTGMPLEESLGVGGGFGGGMSLDESLGVSNGFGGFGDMGVSIDASLGFGGNDYPSTMQGAKMDFFKRGASKLWGKTKEAASHPVNSYISAKTKLSDINNRLTQTKTDILNKTNPYRQAYSDALTVRNDIKEKELAAKQKLNDKRQEIRNANAMRAQEAREIRQARQLADMQHRIAMEAQRQELAQMRQDAYDAQNMRNMMNDVPNQGLSLGSNSPMELGVGGFGGMSLGVGNSVGGFNGMGLGDTLGLPTVKTQQPVVQPQAPVDTKAQYKTESERYPYSNSPRLTTSVDDDYGGFGGGGYHSFMHSEVMGEIKSIKKARKSTSKKTKKVNKNQVKRVKRVAKAKTR